MGHWEWGMPLPKLDEFEAGDEFDDLDEDGQPGPWFTAGFDSEASCCQAGVMEGETIRADGDGGWAHQQCVEGPGWWPGQRDHLDTGRAGQ